ncbi:MAG: hypothetical protein HY072_02920 [Deltaproteobacteria bacterium]|nr:hypothetical protein [Deltaproteobacteria bacterium]
MSAYNKPFPVSEAKVLGIGAVIVIDVLSAKDISSNSESNEQTERLKKYISTAQEARVPQASEVDLVIQPDMSEIGFLDFDKRSEIIFRGKEAVLHNLSRLKHLTGIEEKHE